MGRRQFMVRVLTQEVPGPRAGTKAWLARSVTTGHVAGGSTETVALERLLTAIRILLDAAARDGLAPEDWFERAHLAEPHFANEFARQESSGHFEDLPKSDWTGCRIAPRKVTYEEGTRA